MRIFLDTNVLASAFGTRGLCGDVLREVLTSHDLIVCGPSHSVCFVVYQFGVFVLFIYHDNWCIIQFVDLDVNKNNNLQDFSAVYTQNLGK